MMHDVIGLFSLRGTGAAIHLKSCPVAIRAMKKKGIARTHMPFTPTNEEMEDLKDRGYTIKVCDCVKKVIG